MSLAYLGLDIAKATYQATLLRNGKRFQDEFGRLRSWLRKHRADSIHACLQAAGRYGDDLALYLHTQGYTVSVVNP